MKKLYIDIGGSHLRSEVHDSDTIIRETLSSTETGLLEYIDKMMAIHPQIDFIGIAYAGQVENGEILSAPNIHIDTYKIAAEVEKRYDIALGIDNDLNCAVRAEAAYWKSQSIAALYVGTGLGAALIDQGRIVRGSHNMAFEVGHIPYKSSPLVCGCGRNNCLELYASGSGIAKWLIHSGSTEAPVLASLNSSLREEFEEALLHAAGVLVTLANPEILVLGGGVIEQNPYLATLLREKLSYYALAPSVQNVRIEISALQNAPLEGAKLLESAHG